MANKFPLLFCLFILTFSNCECSDREPGWLLEERLEELTLDLGQVPDLFEDLDLDLDVHEPDGGTVEIEPNIPYSQALNERTALVVDDRGTIWLAYHSCEKRDCSDVNLTLAHRPKGGDWVYEKVKRQRGTFGIELYRNVPVLVFLDPIDNTLKIARRIGKNQFKFNILSVRRTSESDGLDIAKDGNRLFVTFANDRGDPLSTFVLEKDEWRKLQSLEVGNASAAYERGLQADGKGNLFLIHQSGENGDWGVAQYSLSSQRWTQRSYLKKKGVRPSSMIIKGEEICIASDIDDSYLSVSCGSINELENQRWNFPHETLSSYSSMISGNNGDLFVAFNAQNHEELRLAKFPQNGDWKVKTLFQKNSFGVSTAIDSDGLLVVSYYTCVEDRCSIEVLIQRE